MRERCPCCFGVKTKQTMVVEFIRDNPGCTKQQIIDGVYGPNWHIAPKTIDVTINHANNRMLHLFNLVIVGHRTHGYRLMYIQSGEVVGERPNVRI